MSQPHLQIRVALLTDHVAKGWMDGDMYLAYNVMLHHCDWSMGIWHGSAHALAALTGGCWSLRTAQRILQRLSLGRYITQHCGPSTRGNYYVDINNYIPTIGMDKGKKLRKTTTRDYRLYLNRDAWKIPTSSGGRDNTDVQGASPEATYQDYNRVPQTTGGVGVGSPSEAKGVELQEMQLQRQFSADATASQSKPKTKTVGETPTPPSPVSRPQALVTRAEVDVAALGLEAPPVSQGDLHSDAAALLPAEIEQALLSNLQLDSVWLANYLWMFIFTREEVEIIPPWERLWTQDFEKALSDGYSKEDIELAILSSQAGASKKFYIRAKSICDNLDLLIEKGRKFVDRGVLQEHECNYCHALFALYGDMREHQDTCESAPQIDPQDAAEEEMMYAAEDLISEGLMPDPDPMFDPFHDDREDDNWDGLFDPWAEEGQESRSVMVG